tara:strand:+ start:2898 stop:3062 length:165 start_codon:yes stop_codon:yes gene_type:complete
MKLRKDSDELAICDCAYPKLDDSLLIRTKSKLPQYKCKRCDLIWINTKVKKNGY